MWDGAEAGDRAVNGHAFGGGVGLVAAARHRHRGRQRHVRLQRGARRRHPGDDLGRRAPEARRAPDACGSSSPASASTRAQALDVRAAPPRGARRRARRRRSRRRSTPSRWAARRRRARRSSWCAPSRACSMDDGFAYAAGEDRRAVRVGGGGRGHGGLRARERKPAWTSSWIAAVVDRSARRRA